MIAQYPLTALVTLLAVAVSFLAGILVARARRRYDVKAPAVTGHPQFERTFRAQQNVLEWMPMFLPVLWLSAPGVGDRWAAALGLLWCLARIGYLFAYAAAADRRGPYFLVQLAVFAALFGSALYTVARALI